MRLFKMTLHAIKMEWYFQLYVKKSKCKNNTWKEKFEYHAGKIHDYANR